MRSYVPLLLLLVVAFAQCEAGSLLQNLGNAAKTVGEGIKNGTVKAGTKIKEILHLGNMEMAEEVATTVQPELPGVPPVQNGPATGPLVIRTSIASVRRCAPGETFSDGACRSSSIAELE